jgi:hypothetical protein
MHPNLNLNNMDTEGSLITLQIKQRRKTNLTFFKTP